MSALEPLFSDLAFQIVLQRELAIAILFAGALIVALGGLQFRRVGTTVNPMKPQSSSGLVVTGLYSVSRNPMYVGFVLFLFAWGVYLGNFLSFSVLPVFVWLMNRMQIVPEEKILEQHFQDQYRDYKKRVRRWI